MASGEHPLPSPTSHDTFQVTNYTQVPVDDVPSPFLQPRPPFLSADPASSPPNPSLRDSYAQSTPNDSGMLLSKRETDEGEPAGLVADQKPRRRPLLFVLIALAILAIIIIVVVVPVYFTVIKPKSNTSASSPSGSPTTSASHPTSSKTPSTTTVWGGDGTTVRATNGSTFTYNNKLGGICESTMIFCYQKWFNNFFYSGYFDQNDPYKENAYPNSWTPPLNTTWNFATNRINGYASSYSF
jgi:glucan 1,3-beta-glucosidase